MGWTRTLAAGSQQGTPIAYAGVLYMSNPNDVVQTIDTATGNLRRENHDDLPDDVDDYIRGLAAPPSTAPASSTRATTTTSTLSTPGRAGWSGRPRSWTTP